VNGIVSNIEGTPVGLLEPASCNKDMCIIDNANIIKGKKKCKE
jgi:hypothetical protein